MELPSVEKKLDKLSDFVKSPQVGAKGLVYCKYNEDGSSKSNIDKYYDESSKQEWAKEANCKNGDLLLIMSGEKENTRKAIGTLENSHCR